MRRLFCHLFIYLIFFVSRVTYHNVTLSTVADRDTFCRGEWGVSLKKKSFSTQFCNMSDLTNFRWGDLAKICNIPIPYLYPTYNCPSLSRNMLKAWENSKYPRVFNYRVSQKFGAFYIYKSNIQLQQSFFDIIFTNENDTLVAVHRCFYYFL